MAAPAPAPAGARGGLGWLILAAALAVPSFLFYNWWSSLKAEHDRGVTGKAQTRSAGSTVFQPPSAAMPRLVNPMAASTAPAAGLPTAAVKPRFAAPGASTGTAAGAATAATPALQTGVAPAIPSALAPTLGAGPGSELALSSQTVVLARDPMQSPMDVVRIREAEEAEQERLRALAERNKPRPTHKPPKVHQAPISTHIELQGIVAKPDGDNLAIVNGATINPGESFTVDNYSGKVKVISISSEFVTFEYQNKKFKMSVNAE